VKVWVNSIKLWKRHLHQLAQFVPPYSLSCSSKLSLLFLSLERTQDFFMSVYTFAIRLLKHPLSDYDKEL